MAATYKICNQVNHKSLFYDVTFLKKVIHTVLY